MGLIKGQNADAATIMLRTQIRDTQETSMAIIFKSEDIYFSNIFTFYSFNIIKQSDKANIYAHRNHSTQINKLNINR